MRKPVNTVIFGLGNYWDSVKSFLSDEVKIVAYMDNYAKIYGGGAKGISAGAVARIGFRQNSNMYCQL